MIFMVACIVISARMFDFKVVSSFRAYRTYVALFDPPFVIRLIGFPLSPALART